METYSVERIQSLVSSAFGVPRQDLCQGRNMGRFKKGTEARQCSMYLCTMFTKLSLASIARLHGLKDHVTVMHAKKKMHGLITSGCSSVVTLLSIPLPGPFSLGTITVRENL